MEKEKAFRLRARAKSFGYAFKGLAYAFSSQHNLWIHLAVAAAVTVLGLVLGLHRAEWLVLVFAMGFVFVAELFNTALEVLTDLVSPQHQPLAGRVKDVAAAAVLLAALTAATAGLFIFIPKIMTLCF